MPNVQFFSEDVCFQIKNPVHISQWLSNAVENEGLTCGEISIIFTSDDYLLKINQDHLNHDYYTDIITFDYVENQVVSGDLFISLDRVNDNADSLNVSSEHELNRVMVHGVLHLCGYGDKTKEEKLLMRKKEDFYLSLHSQN